MTEDEFAELPEEVRRSIGVSEAYRVAIETMLSELHGTLDFLSSSARSLLVAHGAGLLTTVQLIVSDHAEKLGKVPLFGAVFSLGFLLAVSASFFSYYARDAASLNQKDRSGPRFVVYLYLTAIPLGLSFLILFLTVALIGWQLYKA
ncbi:hypothetical protein [Mesorhizobium sp. M0520]|uniref:hypothetical protein n=1 Tax=Mesorhizobium sp. M0520 TaxID=2956957 RepID=UPI003337767C